MRERVVIDTNHVLQLVGDRRAAPTSARFGLVLAPRLGCLNTHRSRIERCAYQDCKRQASYPLVHKTLHVGAKVTTTGLTSCYRGQLPSIATPGIRRLLRAPEMVADTHAFLVRSPKTDDDQATVDRCIAALSLPD